MKTRQDTKQKKKRSESEWKRSIRTFRHLERMGILGRQGDDGIYAKARERRRMRIEEEGCMQIGVSMATKRYGVEHSDTAVPRDTTRAFEIRHDLKLARPMQIKIQCFWTCNYHRGDYEYYCLLGCDAV
jgi:hypothetical protein